MSEVRFHVAEKSAAYEVIERLETAPAWPRVPLIEAVKLNPKPDRSSLTDETEVSFVPMAAVEAASGRMDASAVRRYVEVKKGYTHFRDGDVLFAKITPCMENGKMAVAHNLCNGIGLGSTEFHVLRPREGVDAHYVYHFVSSARYRSEAAHHMTGAVGQKRVPVAFLEQSEIPLPPLHEQRRVVAEIEKQFSRLDEAVANLTRVKANLKRYKAAVLKAAVEGRLVPSEAEMLLDDETSFWKPIRLAIKSLDQGWSPQCESQASGNDNEWAVMKTTAVQPMMFLESENKRLPSSVTPRDHLELMAGDLLITRAGPRSRVGVSCLVRTTRPRVLLCDKVYRIRPRLEMAVPEYLEVVLNSPTILDSLDKMKTGISDSGLNLTQKGFSELLVPLPSLADQGRIVSEVDRLVSLVRGVEGEVEANLNRAEVLRRATLERVLEAPAMGGYSRRTQAANPAPETEPR